MFITVRDEFGVRLFSSDFLYSVLVVQWNGHRTVLVRKHHHTQAWTIYCLPRRQQHLPWFSMLELRNGLVKRITSTLLSGVENDFWCLLLKSNVLNTFIGFAGGSHFRFWLHFLNTEWHDAVRNAHLTFSSYSDISLVVLRVCLRTWVIIKELFKSQPNLTV